MSRENTQNKKNRKEIMVNLILDVPVEYEILSQTFRKHAVYAPQPLGEAKGRGVLIGGSVTDGVGLIFVCSHSYSIGEHTICENRFAIETRPLRVRFRLSNNTHPLTPEALRF